MPDARTFILENLRLEPTPGVPEIRLYRAHAGSRLSRLGEIPPYWAYHWAGGTVLARHILDHPQTVQGRRGLDLGTGSGIVAIAAAMAGAQARAVDIDPWAVAAAELNTEANGVGISITEEDLLAGDPPETDLILVGDLFYDAVLAEKVSAFLERCVAAGIEVLVGDMGRKPLPIDYLEPLAEYEVPDFGQSQPLKARVFRFKDKGRKAPCLHNGIDLTGPCAYSEDRLPNRHKGLS